MTEWKINASSKPYSLSRFSVDVLQTLPAKGRVTAGRTKENKASFGTAH